MADIIISPNMNLPVPIVSEDLGPDWANNVNACLAILDQHNHSAGSGVPVTPAGLNINSDLPINSNNLTLARSVRFSSQLVVLSGASDLSCAYDVLGDLYYNDGSGNKIQITQNGGIAGTSGSISNLTPPASASYVAVSETFVWQSAANTPANLDCASIILRNLAANSKGLTLNPPAAMGSNYSITLPPLPGALSLVSIDASGNEGTVSTDATLLLVGSLLGVAPGSITTSQISASAGILGSQLSASAGIVGTQLAAGTLHTAEYADASVTPAKLSAVNDNSFTDTSNTGSTTFQNIGTCTITASGVRPITVKCFPAPGTGAIGFWALTYASTGSISYIQVLRDDGTRWIQQIGRAQSGISGSVDYVALSALSIVDESPSAGSRTYSIQARVVTALNIAWQNLQARASED